MHANSPELRNLVAVARDVTDSVIARHAQHDDAEAAWPAESLRALADAGLMGLHVPPALGGHGQGLGGLVAVAQTIARESPAAALCYAMHCVGTAVIAAKATDHQKQRYLEPIARGEHITTLALSEPGTGAFFWMPQTRLTRDGEGFVVHGTKSFITNGGHADSYVVSTASAVPGDELGTFSCVVLDHDRPNLRWDAEWRGLGMRGNSSRTLHLESVPLPQQNLLGAEGDQLWYVFEVIAPYFLMAMAGTYTGVAQAAFDIAREHLGSRRHAHTGELLGSQPVLAHRLGELWLRLEQTQRLVGAAAQAADAGDPDYLVPVFGCKAAAAEASVHITNEAMTLVGGIGYRENARLARLLRDARASHVMSPTTDLLKLWIGRALLNLPLL